MKWRCFGHYLFFVCENYYTSTHPLMEVMIKVTVTTQFLGFYCVISYGSSET